MTTTLLEIVSEARELRDAAEREWRNAIVRARAGRHTLEEIGRAAGLKKAGVAYVLKRETLFPVQDPEQEKLQREESKS